ncbi:MAG: 2-amino-4-hydroxy-6-hydroxymethyldihydropteridine diphosphokinase [Candidatus Oxydemutatoraceae bacterium WSBS_2016_MAG_OTU14]
MSHKEISVIALGANLDSPWGSPDQTIELAIQSLLEIPSAHLIARSRLYKSAAIGVPDQVDYFNAVGLLEVQIPPLQLLDQLLAIETHYGRVRDGERWGARTLDLDMVAYGQQVIDEKRLQVPHPEAFHRCFVLAPLAEVAPKLVLTGYGVVEELLKKCDTGVACPFEG